MPLRPEATLETARAIGVGQLPGLTGFNVRSLEQNRLEAALAVRPVAARG